MSETKSARTDDAELLATIAGIEARQQWRKENNWTSRCSMDVDILLDALKQRIAPERKRGEGK